MSTLVRVVLLVALVASAFLFVASWLVGPSLALLGPIHYLTLIPGMGGFVLLVGAWRRPGVRGYHEAGFALCGVTFVFGFLVVASGLRMMFQLLGTDSIAADALLFRQMMARGMAEAMGSFLRYCATAVLQFLLWTMLAIRFARPQVEATR